MAGRLRIFAPATIANLGPGFDVLGLALTSPGDMVEAELSERPGVEIVEVTGDQGLLSRDPVENVAGRAAGDVLRRAAETTIDAEKGYGPFSASPDTKRGRTPFRGQGVRLWVHKQMPLASGLGSSGASSAAAAVATNELLGRPLTQHDLLLSAMEGERAASGTPHADNVAPSVMGGVILVRSYEPLDILSLPVPSNLRMAVVHPHCKVSTAAARTLVKDRTYRLEQIVPNLGNIAAFVMALYSGDLALLGRSIEDRLIEPLRAASIPGFHAVKDAALTAGALGCSIAGSGPSVFAFASDDELAHRVGTAMQSAFKSSAGLESDLYAGVVSPIGARIV
jgi:homoserine kinase